MNTQANQTVIAATLTVGENMDALALRLAAIAAPSMDTAIDIVVKAKDDWDGGPIAIMMAAINDYDQETLESFPDPDVKTGNNPAVYMVPSYKDGKRGKDKEVHFYSRFADGKPRALAIKARQEMLTRAGNDKMKQDGIAADIIAMNADQRDQERAKLDKALTNFRTAIKNGFKLMFKIKAVNGLPGCECYVVPGAVEGTFDNLIHVNSTVKGRETVDWDNLSISTFNKLNIAKAQESGGTFSALMATKKRGKSGGDDGDDNSDSEAKPSLIRTVDTYTARLVDTTEYMDHLNTAKDKAEYTDLLKKLGPKGGEGTDQLALTQYQYWQMLNDIYKHEPIRARGQALALADATSESVAV